MKLRYGRSSRGFRFDAFYHFPDDHPATICSDRYPAARAPIADVNKGFRSLPSPLLPTPLFGFIFISLPSGRCRDRSYSCVMTRSHRAVLESHCFVTCTAPGRARTLDEILLGPDIGDGSKSWINMVNECWFESWGCGNSRFTRYLGVWGCLVMELLFCAMGLSVCGDFMAGGAVFSVV